MSKTQKEHPPTLMPIRLVCYPNTRIKKIVIALSYTRDVKISKVVVEALKILIKAIPEAEQDKLLKVYEGLTDEQRSMPHRVIKKE